MPLNRINRIITQSILATVLVAAGAAPSLAATFIVSNLSDGAAPGPAGSLRRAVNDANVIVGTDIINFQAGVAGVITLTNGELNISGDVTINGPGANVIIVSGNNASRVFSLNFGVSATINGLGLTNGLSDRGPGLASAGNFTLNNCSVTSCNATVDGGGIILLDGRGTMSGCAVANNHCNGNGGGIWLGQGGAAIRSLSMTNCTVSDNAADGIGGGIRQGANATTDLTLTNCTIAGNSSNGNGGGINRSFGTLTMKNTIIAKNNNATNPDISSTGGTITSNGYNIVGNNTGAAFAAGPADQIGTSASPIDPLLAPLAFNGSGTQTRALRLGSPAIDAGSVPPSSVVDQRGQPRPAAAVCGLAISDIGAFEMLRYSVTNLNDAGGGSLRQAILDNNNWGGGQICMGVTGTITLTSGALNIARMANIGGPGAAALTISGNNADRVAVVNGPGTTIANVTVANGKGSDGAGVISFVDLYVDGCFFTHNVGTVVTNGGGGIEIVTGRLTARNSTFDGNTHPQLGGGIGVLNGNADISNCTFNNNDGGVGGGAIACAGLGGAATATVTSCTIVNSPARGIFNAAQGAGATSNLTFRNTLFSNNTGGSVLDFNASGGCVTPSAGHNLTSDSGNGFFTGSGDIVNTASLVKPLANNGGPTFTCAIPGTSPAVDAGTALGTPAYDQRGAVRPGSFGCGGAAQPDIGAFELQRYSVNNIANAGLGTLRDAVNANNAFGASEICFALPPGPQTIVVTTGEMSILLPLSVFGPGAKQLTLDGNLASRAFALGGGVSADIHGLRFANCRAPFGGAIENFGGTIVIDQCQFDGNAGTDPTDGGGAIENFGGTMTLLNSTFLNNAHPQFGGAVSNINGTAVMTNCTLQGNNGGGAGGSATNIASGTTSTLDMINCTVADTVFRGVCNFAVTAGSAKLTITNNIFSFNGAVAVNSENLGGTAVNVVSNGHNLSTDSGSGFLIGPGDLINTNPVLLGIADNGAQVQTRALSLGSPAIDAGDMALATTTDERGLGRRGCSADIGAYEFQSGGPNSGDFDGSGRIDIADWPIFINVLLGKLSAPACIGDMNNDGKTNGADEQLFVAGLLAP